MGSFLHFHPCINWPQPRVMCLVSTSTWISGMATFDICHCLLVHLSCSFRKRLGISAFVLISEVLTPSPKRIAISLVNNLLDCIQGCKIFSVIDLKSAYSHVCIKEGDDWKTAFQTPYGLFEHLIVHYGLTNTPDAFQSFIQDTLCDILDIFCVIYLNDILIFSHSQEEHDTHVKMVLDHLWDAQLCANPAKCEFDKSEVEFLGFIISANGIKMNLKKLNTITSWPTPTNVKNIQQFLGFTNFYWWFIDNYLEIISPLTALI